MQNFFLVAMQQGNAVAVLGCTRPADFLSLLCLLLLLLFPLPLYLLFLHFLFIIPYNNDNFSLGEIAEEQYTKK